MLPTADLRQALLAERNAAFLRLRGGYPIPLAGAIWWTLLGLAGYKLTPHTWGLLAFVTSGTIFPLALLLARIFGVDFMRDRTAVAEATFPALTAMLLFWPAAIAAYWTYPQLVPLILAVGMAGAWLVIGWTYGRTAPLHHTRPRPRGRLLHPLELVSRHSLYPAAPLRCSHLPRNHRCHPRRHVPSTVYKCLDGGCKLKASSPRSPELSVLH